MKIGIVGAGNMGSAFARRLAAAGHELALTSADPAEAHQLAGQVGRLVRAVPQAEVGQGTDLLILAVPYPNGADALRAVLASNRRLLGTGWKPGMSRTTTRSRQEN
jgi:8-hydroxy-5-deazaflavin:NADPH oxidoreductase